MCKHTSPSALNRNPVFRKRIVAALCALLLTVASSALSSQEQAAAATGTHPLPPNTDTLTYWYGPNYHTIFVTRPHSGQTADIARNSIELTHVDFWSKGSNFGDVVLNKSNIAEPATGGGAGAMEVYFTWRSNFGLNAMTGTRAFHLGPVRDVRIEVGTNLETKNSAYAPAEKTIYFGPNLQFAVPKGYLNVGLHLRKEWNHEAILGKTDDYAPDFNIEPNWLLPFTVGKAHMAWQGFADYNTQKGKDSFGSPTVSEFLVRHYVSLDAGGLLFHRPQVLDVNAGFWYWNNEYGKKGSLPGGEQLTPIFGVTVHLGHKGAQRAR